MADEMKGRKLGGDGMVAEIDGGYFGGYVKPANHRETRRDRRLASNQTGKRKAVVIIRERNGRSLPAVFRTEGQALSFIRSRIAKGTIINADEGSSWDALHAQYEMKRINHEEAYSLDGACTNWAEEFFSRMRRAEQGHHHHIAGPYLLRYAQEASWRAGESLGMDRHLKVKTAKHRNQSLFRQGCMLYELIPNMPEARLRPLVARFREYLNQHGAFNQTFAVV